MKNNVKISDFYKERIDIIALIVSAVFGIFIGGCLMFLFLSGTVDTKTEQNINNNSNITVSSVSSSNA